MKLEIFPFDFVIDYELNKIHTLEIRNRTLFQTITESLYNEIEINQKGIEHFRLKQDEQLIPLNKNCMLITNYLSIDSFQSQIIKGLTEYLIKNLEEEKKIDVHHNLFKVRAIINEELQNLGVQFNLKEEFTVGDLLKFYQVKVDNQIHTTIFEKVSVLIELISILKLTKIVIFINLKQFLTNLQWDMLIKDISYKKLNILLIESTATNYKNLREKKIEIDENYDEWQI